MKRILRTKKNKIIIAFLIVIISASYMIFSKGDYKNYKGEESFKALMGVLFNTIENKDAIILEEKDINALGSTYFKEGLKKGNLIISGLNIKLKEDNVTVLVPIRFKGLPLMLSSRGKFSFNNGNVNFVPDYFKVGKISLPKNLILSYIKNNLKDKIVVEGDKLSISSSILPIKVDNMKIDDGKVILSYKQEANEEIKKASEAIKKLEQQLKDQLDKKLNNSNLESSTSKSNSDKVSSDDYNKNNNSTAISGNNTNSSNNSTANGENMNGSFDKVAKDLNSLYGDISTPKEKQMVGIMNSTVNNLMGNSDYNFWGDMKEVMSIYKTLSPEEKKKFKTKVFDNIDLENALKIKNNYGM